MKRKLRAILKVYGFSFNFGCHLSHIYSTAKRLTLLSSTSKGSTVFVEATDLFALISHHFKQHSIELGCYNNKST